MAKQQSSGSNTNLLSTSLLAACWAQGRVCSPQHMEKLHSESEMYQAGLQRQPNIWVSRTREAPVGSKFCLSARYVNQINCKPHGDFTLGASKQNFWPHHEFSATTFTPRCNMRGREISSCLLACPRSVSPSKIAMLKLAIQSPPWSSGINSLMLIWGGEKKVLRITQKQCLMQQTLCCRYRSATAGN